MLATGAFLGALATVWFEGCDDARAFGRFPRLYCEDAGRQSLTNDAGRGACVVWYD